MPMVAAAIAMVLALAAALLASDAPAQQEGEEPKNAESLLGVNVARGYIDVAMIAPRDSEVTFFEEVGEVRQELGKAGAAPPAAGGNDGLASIPAIPWKCDRTVRRFVGVAVTPDDKTIEAVNEARTPDCRDRLSLSAPSQVKPGAKIPVTIKDRWQLGDLKFRLCVKVAGRSKCSKLRLKPGQKKLTLTRNAGRKVALLDLDVVVGRFHRHKTVGVGRKAPAAPRPTLLVTGDSMIQGIDAILGEKLKKTYRVVGQTRPGTGVSKPLDTPWTTVARQQASKHKPAVTVVLLGGNDGFKMKTAAGQEVECCGEPWRAEYAERIERMAIAYARRGAGTVIWGLLPPAKRTDLHEQMDAVNDSIRRMARRMPEVHLVGLDKIFGPEYRDTVQGRKVRDPDGLHFNLAGQRIAAQAIIDALRKAKPAK